MRQRGFTLIELIVATAVVAIMGGVAYAGWFNVERIARTTQASVDQYDAMERAFYWLQEDLEQIINRDVVDDLGSKQKPLQVSQTGEFALKLTRGGWSNPALLQLPPRSDLQRVAYVVDDKQRLMRRYWYHVDRFDTTQFKERRLLDGVNSFTFRFLDLEGGEWQNTWPPEQASIESQGDYKLLPAAAEVTLEVEKVGSVTRLFILPY